MDNYAMEKQIEEWLHDYKSIKAFITELEFELNDRAYDNISVDTSKEPTSKTYKFNSVVENAAFSMNKEKQILKGNKRLISKLDTALNSLSITERKIVVYRCIDNKFYYQFTCEVGFAERTCKKIKKQAIIKMRKAIFGE